jgi:pantoate--beta-alanine ligase
MIKILSTTAELVEYRNSLKGTVGFVPTMGALHEGHASLLREARLQSDHVILSIFVNPTQFNDPSDLEKYPRTFDADRTLAEKERVDALFFPKSTDLYGDQFRFEVREKQWSQRFCGAHRPGHFEGVLTIVLKLFNLVRPNLAFFGEKDYQQLRLISDMVAAFFLPLKVVPVPTMREADGLAMSSRNVRLSPAAREKAPLFYKILRESSTAEMACEQLLRSGFEVDYVEDWEGRRLGAIVLDSVRLIDNVETH